MRFPLHLPFIYKLNKDWAWRLHNTLGWKQGLGNLLKTKKGMWFGGWSKWIVKTHFHEGSSTLTGDVEREGIDQHLHLRRCITATVRHFGVHIIPTTCLSSRYGSQHITFIVFWVSQDGAQTLIAGLKEELFNIQTLNKWRSSTPGFLPLKVSKTM